MFKLGQETMCADEIIRFWKSLTIKSIYKSWDYWGRLSVLWRTSLYDSAPLVKLIKENISLDRIRASGKKVSVGTVSLTSGKYTIFNQDSDDFIDAVLASSAFPVIMSPVKIGTELWLDGGMKQITPLHTAIEMGATEIDVIITSPETRNKHFIPKPNIVDVIKRAFDLSTDKIMSNDLEKAIMYNKMAEAMLINKKVVKLNIIRPDLNLIEDSFDFDPIKIGKMIELGYEDTKKKYNT